MVVKYIEHLIDHGLVQPFHIPNYPTKTCVLASMAFAADATGLLTLGGSTVILTCFSLLVLSLRLFVANQSDPYAWLESLTYGLVYGLPEETGKKVIFVTRSLLLYRKKSCLLGFI